MTNYTTDITTFWGETFQTKRTLENITSSHCQCNSDRHKPSHSKGVVSQEFFLRNAFIYFRQSLKELVQRKENPEEMTQENQIANQSSGRQQYYSNNGQEL